jgi:hypothetical protein
MTDDVLDRTRRGLHAVAELVLAGPQHRTSGTIRLHVTSDGFGTVAAPQLRIAGTELVADGRMVAIDGQTPRALAAAVGVEPGAPVGLYRDGSGASVDDVMHVDPAAAQRLLGAYALGADALRLVAPDVEPVLWPEHFDVGIRVGQTNLGVSPGDTYIDEPYAYVGVDPVPSDPYWNAPFGRATPMDEFADATTLRDFYAEGLDRAR